MSTTLQAPVVLPAEQAPHIRVPFSALALAEEEPSPVLHGVPPPRALLPWWWNPLAVLAVALILCYRNILPNGWKRRCIYTPTCSLYGLRSIQLHGLMRGARRTWLRFRRCNGVLYLGGIDEP